MLEVSKGARSADLSLVVLARAESGEALEDIRADLTPRIDPLVAAGEEGELLAKMLEC